jgi:ubiquinone/menaquinone biosynthesis C-methylase UbiE
MIMRGGHPELEVAHSRMLGESDPEVVWGWSTPAGGARVESRIRWLTKVCHFGPGVRVLECGCGTGIFTKGICATGAQIVAVDISNDFLDKARVKIPQKNVSFLRVDLENPQELPDNSFDAIVGISVLHHLDLNKALPALRRKLVPGARFAFSEPNMTNPINKYFLFVDKLEKRRLRWVSPYEQAFLRDELFDYFTKFGFRVDSIEHRDFLHPAIPKALIPLCIRIERLAERLPLVKLWSGSLWIWGEWPR